MDTLTMKKIQIKTPWVDHFTFTPLITPELPMDNYDENTNRKIFLS